MTKLSWPIDRRPPEGHGIVYLVTLPHGKRYIGATKRSATQRLYHHKKRAQTSMTNLHKSLRSQDYQADICVLEVAPLDRLFEREAALILEHGTFGAGGLNATPGGEGVVSTMPESEERRVSRMKSTMSTSEYRDKQRRVQAEVWTEERRQARAEQTKKKWADPDFKARAYACRRKPRNTKPRNEPFAPVAFPDSFAIGPHEFRKAVLEPSSDRPNLTVRSWFNLPNEFGRKHISLLGWKPRDLERGIRNGWISTNDIGPQDSAGNESPPT